MRQVRAHPGLAIRSPMRRHCALLPWLALLVGGCGLNSPMTTVAPKSDFGRQIHELFMNISGWTLFIFIVVEGLRSPGRWSP